MIEVDKVIDIIEEFAPLGLAEEWDNRGGLWRKYRA